MHTDNEANGCMTEDEERRLGEILPKALISGNPNPDRKDCPDPKLIRDLAFHKRIGDPQLFERVTAHMAGCSACVQDALGYVEEYKTQNRRHRKARFAMAIAATVVLAIALWAISRNQPKQQIMAKPQSAPVQIPADQVVADASPAENKLPKIAQFESVTIELPLRWRGNASADEAIVIPRARMQLEILLPIGSPEGKYKLRIVDKSGKVQKTAEGIARTANGITSLKTTMETSALSPGDYRISVLEPGLDEWADYRMALR